jgi:hypothetical protein
MDCFSNVGPGADGEDEYEARSEELLEELLEELEDASPCDMLIEEQQRW